MSHVISAVAAPMTPYRPMSRSTRIGTQIEPASAASAMAVALTTAPGSSSDQEILRLSKTRLASHHPGTARGIWSR